MTVKFQDTVFAFSSVLASATAMLHETPMITIRDLLKHFGEQGLLFFCILLTLPFLTPLSLPILNFILGTAMIRLSIGIIFNHVPSLSSKIMKREIRAEKLIPTLEKSTHFFIQLERWVYPRWRVMTENRFVKRMNGITLLLGSILFVFPFDRIPLADTLPAWGILLLALGMLQRDGLWIVVSYGIFLTTIIYIAITLQGIGTAGVLL